MPVARSSKHKVLSCQALPPFHPISLLPSRLLILCACAIPNTFPAKKPEKRHESGLYLGTFSLFDYCDPDSFKL